MDNLDAKMDNLVINPLKGLRNQISYLFHLTEKFQKELPPFFTVFEDILLKFVVFYRVIYQQEELPEQDIEFMMDTKYIELIQCDFLIRLANCIQMNNFEPESCFRPNQIHNFLDLLNWSCEIAIDQIKEYNRDSLVPLLRHLYYFQNLLKLSKGEWYNNDNPSRVSDSIPLANGESYFEGEYMDYDYIPPPANMF
jgi:hypothetical protein